MTAKRLLIAAAGLYHETNSFAPGKTRRAEFERNWVRDTDMFRQLYSGTNTSMGGILAAAERHRARLAVSLYTQSPPGGLVDGDDCDAILDELVDSLEAKADGIVLVLHGAMMSEREPDVEGECLRRVRARFPHIPIAITLDMHANISAAMVRQCDVMVGYDTYPHIDMYERAEEAFDDLVRCIGGEIRPVSACAHTGMLVAPQGMMTETGGMKELMKAAFRLEEHEKVINITVAGGFPYSDTPSAGMSFVVTTNGDRDLARQFAQRLAEMAIERKETLNVPYVSARQGVDLALSEDEGPVILAEGSDNVGGGAPADATHVLKHLTDASKKSLIVIRDAQAVRAACDAGVGSDFSAPVGGKTDTLHGAPVMVRGKVRHLFDGRYTFVGPYRKGQRSSMGTTAVVESGNLTMVLTERRVAPMDVGHVRYAGLWPGDFHIIVVKSAIAWQTAFGSIARRVLYVDTPGCCGVDLTLLEYRQVSRPIWPLDGEPVSRPVRDG